MRFCLSAANVGAEETINAPFPDCSCCRRRWPFDGLRFVQQQRPPPPAKNTVVVPPELAITFAYPYNLDFASALREAPSPRALRDI